MSLRGISKDWNPADSTDGTIIIGQKRGTWPLHAFSNMGHATSWVSEDPQNHRVWVVDVKVLYELFYVPPGQARLEPEA